MGLSKEEIAKVKEEWEQKLVKKKEKEREKEKQQTNKETENGKNDGKADDEDKNKGKSKDRDLKAALPVATTPPARPTHERYTLHRDFFAMRLSDHRKRRQTAQAKELAPRLPGAPRGGLEDIV